MKYLVTGGAGFIGSNLVDKLIEQNHEVVIIDNLSSGKKEDLNPKAKFYNLDICDFEKIKPIFSGIDYVFHLAAIPRVFFSVENPTETSKTNILGTINVFKAAAQAKVKRVVFYSSSAVYGDQKEKIFKESTPTNPVSPYGLQKLVGEQFAKLFLELYKIPIVCLRVFNVYGPRIDFDTDYGLVVGKFLYLKSQNKPLTIYGNGEQTRGFCYVGDLADVSIKAMESSSLKGGEIINISGENSYSVNHIAKIIGGKIIYLPKRDGDPENTKADVSLAKKLLDWSPKINLEDGIKKTSQWLDNYIK
ncbi:MAG: NAD-dependent epimerase/dehydratase family protein [Candidatus Staskawiczbacteria bacterium]|nr:NAD-dependent epimerase/dehydratase family protein [Candidatus Staskawiczbacteria bacterium]